MENCSLDFEQIYREFYPLIHRCLIRCIGRKEAEDLAQEVFIKAGKSLDAFRSEAQVSARRLHFDPAKGDAFSRKALS